METETTLATQSQAQGSLTRFTREQKSSIISTTPDGRRGVSIYANQEPFTDDDFNGVVCEIMACYPQMKDTHAGVMRLSLIKTAARQAGFSKMRLKDAVMHHMMTSRFSPMPVDIVSYDKLVEVLGWGKVDNLNWPHDPVAMLFLPNGKFEFVWEKDLLPEYGYKWKHYETPAEHQHKLEMEAASITPEEREAYLKKIQNIKFKSAK